MHASQLLHKFLLEKCPSIHARRLNALMVAVKTVSTAHRLTVTGMGRALDNGALTKHRIKRMDRLVGNTHVLAESAQLYALISRWLIGNTQRPVLIVDWSDLTADRKWHLLRASIPVGGRTLTLYEEVHPQQHYGSPRVHQTFLRKLKTLLPGGIQPIVITDAGFRSTWFKQVEKLNGDWIGRVRNRDLYQPAGHTHWAPCKALYGRATTQPTKIGDVLLVRNRPYPCTLYLVRKPKQGRIKKSVFGKPLRSKHSNKDAQREREPWLIATSTGLKDASARQIIALYRQRMQIEEAFRDIKSERYGLGLSASQTRSLQRLRVLLLIGALALFVLWLVGSAAIRETLQRQFQSNTLRTRRVLSVIYLGMQVMRRMPDAFNKRQLMRAVDDLHSVLRKTQDV